ncbi:MAG: lactate racemase domain-containing protein [Clostridiales Family XIII bacterium]|jgi:hypothetical protein|nr:lactate racemase domain-containing protein [Clostridiales Family XIII bacterium]
MPILPEEAAGRKIPKMYAVKQIFADEHIHDADEAVAACFADEDIRRRVRPGVSVAIAVGSRGITSLKEIVRAVVINLKSLGAEPFLTPAMGSHGGGDAEMQKKILEDYGVTEQFVGAPVLSSMETVVIGQTDDGIPIHMDALAARADAIVPVARVKPHTDFSAPIESGLCKMLTIGLGKHNGCARLHREGFSSFPDLIPRAAKTVIRERFIAFGIAVIENAHKRVHSIHAIPGDAILDKEPGLLSLSKSLLPKLHFAAIDVLIVEQIGKDITGAGMDPNITGKTPTGLIPGFDGPRIKRIVALSLSPGAHRNATGIGMADFTTKEVYAQIDFFSTYANCIASGTPEAAKIPIMLETEAEAVHAAIQTAAKTDIDNIRMVRIRDTSNLGEILVSEALLRECESMPDKFRF